jgi:hypothetical protein
MPRLRSHERAAARPILPMTIAYVAPQKKRASVSPSYPAFVSLDEVVRSSQRPRHEEVVAFDNAPTHHLVQLGNANGKPTTQRRGQNFLLVNPTVREKACVPSALMRMVCNPGTESCPRDFWR